MTSIHPSESPQWGWLVPCLAVGDLQQTLDWYRRLGFERFGPGDPAQGWAMIRSRAIELHLFDRRHIERDLLNYRGGDLGGIRAALEARGLEVASTEGPSSFTLLDPDGRPVFFDIGADEVAQFASGQPLTAPLPEGAGLDEGDLDLGNLSWCLACEDLDATSAFYAGLDFTRAGGQPEAGWVVLARADHRPAPGERLRALYLSLFSGMIPSDMLNFRGGDVGGIARALVERGVPGADALKTGPDGGESLLLTDPDGRAVFFDTTPPERLG